MTLTMTENILRTYSLGTLAEIRAGAEWYNDAHALALQIANGDAWKGAGVIAAYSPLTPWNRNVELARDTFRSGVARNDTLGTSYRAARRILSGEHALDVLKGDKTRAFASAIATNGISDIATIDRHAFDIAKGEIHTDTTRNIGKRIYREIAGAYTIAANETGFSVAQIQAITWVIHRRVKGIHYAG